LRGQGPVVYGVGVPFAVGDRQLVNLAAHVVLVQQGNERPRVRSHPAATRLTDRHPTRWLPTLNTASIAPVCSSNGGTRNSSIRVQVAMSLADGPLPMNRPVRHRSTRDRPAKTPLSEDAVVDAVLAILRSDGLEAVTVRRVAHALDTGAASLYVYVSGREGGDRRRSVRLWRPTRRRDRRARRTRLRAVGCLCCAGRGRTSCSRAAPRR
jgi:hypothetical protein